LYAAIDLLKRRVAVYGRLAFSKTGKVGAVENKNPVLAHGCWSELQNILAEVPVGSHMVQFGLHHILVYKNFSC